MIGFLDTSIVLAFLLHGGEQHQAPPWKRFEITFASRLLQVESLRRIDRLRFEESLTEEDIANIIIVFQSLLRNIGEIPLSEAVLHRASLPFSTKVHTLDAIHLSSALLLQEQQEDEVIFLTRDRQLGIAARAVGLQAQGFG